MFIHTLHLSIIILFKTIITFYSILSYIANIRHHNNCFMKIKFTLTHQLFHEKCITKFILTQQLFQNSFTCHVEFLFEWLVMRNSLRVLSARDGVKRSQHRPDEAFRVGVLDVDDSTLRGNVLW